VVEDRKLLAEGQDLELECHPVLKGGKERPKQRNENGSHAPHVTLGRPKTSRIPGVTKFSGGTPQTSQRGGQ